MMERLEDIVAIGVKAGYQHFLLSLNAFDPFPNDKF